MKKIFANTVATLWSIILEPFELLLRLFFDLVKLFTVGIIDLKRKIIDGLYVDRVVDYIVRVGTQSTSNGSYIFYFSSLSLALNVSKNWIEAHKMKICKALNKRKELIDEVWVGYECFDCMFGLDFCPNAELD